MAGRHGGPALSNLGIVVALVVGAGVFAGGPHAHGGAIEQRAAIAERAPAVRLFVMGTGDGHKDANGRFFHGDGSLTTARPAAADPATKYVFDPGKPVPTIGGSFSGNAALSPAGAFDQQESTRVFGSTPPYRALKDRPDVIEFQSEVLPQDTEVIGPIVVKLFASSNTPWADRFVTVNGLRLHYLDWGGAGKPPLLMLHGIARHAHTFDHIAADLSRDFHVLALDLRGHGDSGWSPDGAYLVEDYVKDLEGVVGQLGLNKLTLLGNSTGGRVAQVFAGMHPELVARLVVEDVGPERPEDVASGFARRVQQETNGWASEDELVAQLVKQNARTPEPLLRTYARYGLTRRSDGRMVWKRDPNLVKGFVVTELWHHVRRVTAPTIYILGGASTIVPAATQQRLKETLPQVEVVTMPGLGHYPDAEDTAGFMTILNRFLKRS